MAVLGFDSVHFSFADHVVLAGVSLEARVGELLVILGPSGSGKSTLLRLAAGLEAPGAGTIYLNERPASASGRVLVGPAERRIALVFQDLALWPHLSSDEQLHFTGPGLDSGDRRRLLRDVGLDGLETRLPGHMSGGERQRLALARALAGNPRLLLLDEPFANLDGALRRELRGLLRELKRRHGASIVYVTHDLEDAFGLADRIAVLNEGRIEQTGAPEDVYLRPATAFVAAFVGTCAIVSGRIEAARVLTPVGAFPNPRPDLGNGSDIEVVLRPEDVEPGEGHVRAHVEEVVFQGDRYLLRLATGSGSIWAHASTRPVLGDAMAVRVRRGWPVRPSGRLHEPLDPRKILRAPKEP